MSRSLKTSVALPLTEQTQIKELTELLQESQSDVIKRAINLLYYTAKPVKDIKLVPRQFS